MIVYHTETGKCYHRLDCTYLAKSCISITLSNAVKTYDPCSGCKPPRLGEYKSSDEDSYIRKSGGSSNSYSSGNKMNKSASQRTSPSNDYRVGVCCVAIVGTAFVAYKANELRKEKQRKELEEAVRQQKFNEEKQEFLRYLNGRSIRDIASVPKYITFVNGLPRDNNDSQYGSYTVYLSQSGKCYHRKQGCCSARYPQHAFAAAKYYKPCSKCYKGVITEPEWYLKYKELYEKCRKYNVTSV